MTLSSYMEGPRLLLLNQRHVGTQGNPSAAHMSRFRFIWYGQLSPVYGQLSFSVRPALVRKGALHMSPATPSPPLL